MFSGGYSRGEDLVCKQAVRQAGLGGASGEGEGRDPPEAVAIGEDLLEGGKGPGPLEGSGSKDPLKVNAKAGTLGRLAAKGHAEAWVWARTETGISEQMIYCTVGNRY